MRKNIMIISILCILTIVIGIFFIQTININLFDTLPSSNQFDSIMQNENVYYDLFTTMLYPYVEEVVTDYYSDYMIHPPHVAP